MHAKPNLDLFDGVNAIWWPSHPEGNAIANLVSVVWSAGSLKSSSNTVAKDSAAVYAFSLCTGVSVACCKRI